MKKILVFVLTLNAFGACSRHKEDVASIEKIIVELETAVTTGDKSAWDRNLTDSAFMINRDGNIYTKSELISEINKPPAGREFRIDVANLKIVVNGNSALATFIADEKLSIFGQKMDTRFRTTDYFEKVSGQWKLVMFQYFEVPVDPVEIKADSIYLSQFAGRYALSPEVYADVVVEDGDLIVVKMDNSRRRLIPLDANGRFFFKGEEGERFFIRNAQGKFDLYQRRNWKDLIWRNIS